MMSIFVAWRQLVGLGQVIDRVGGRLIESLVGECPTLLLWLLSLSSVWGRRWRAVSDKGLGAAGEAGCRAGLRFERPSAPKPVPSGDERGSSLLRAEGLGNAAHAPLRPYSPRLRNLRRISSRASRSTESRSRLSTISAMTRFGPLSPQLLPWAR